MHKLLRAIENTYYAPHDNSELCLALEEFCREAGRPDVARKAWLLESSLSVQEDAYNEGYAEGHSDGASEGYDEGHADAAAEAEDDETPMFTADELAAARKLGYEDGVKSQDAYKAGRLDALAEARESIPE